MAVLARQGSSFVSPLVSSLIRGGDNISSVVLVIDRFLRGRFVYRDERDEVLRDVPFMLNDLDTYGYMMGDCDDMSIMCGSLLCNIGIPARFTAIKSANPEDFDHVYTEAKVGSDWVPIDPTVPYGTRYTMFGFISEVVC